MDSSEPPNCEPPSWCQYQRLVPGDTVNEHMSLRLVKLWITAVAPAGYTCWRTIAEPLCT